MADEGSWRGIAIAQWLTPIQGIAYRIVESQEQVATLDIVDTLAEQSLLEELLEHSKPAMRPGTGGLHYLLMTPFRYPPLRHGSRFGRRHEPSIFYGSHCPSTALAEAAYYRLVFREGMAAPPTRPVRSEHTLFGAAYATHPGLQLQRPPFDAEQAALTDPQRYTETQTLGAAMRSEGVLAFEFTSARDPARGTNAGLFEPTAFASPGVQDQQQWLCEVDGGGVRFLSFASHEVVDYPRDGFLVDGQLPMPAL
ncbi:RES family NAD+ phosphorylase [Pseudohaliea rubra]|uniref:RES domain-containing protein n=1 Tax=Pseudohaliea rubra DSM 19751 TaxID=1265313 RepID=A0A095VR00_9GAMM|nr:RES family NAD+ phosphorylase [Pseudohaliea rubra]KGE03805.1 hypothetical protein HRUBRA_01552 [Pseudohaliea rubra DSM 19751]